MSKLKVGGKVEVQFYNVPDKRFFGKPFITTVLKITDSYRINGKEYHNMLAWNGMKDRNQFRIIYIDHPTFGETLVIRKEIKRILK